MYRATYYSEREDTQVLNLMLMKSKAEFNGRRLDEVYNSYRLLDRSVSMVGGNHIKKPPIFLESI